MTATEPHDDLELVNYGAGWALLRPEPKNPNYYIVLCSRCGDRHDKRMPCRVRPVQGDAA